MRKGPKQSRPKWGQLSNRQRFFRLLKSPFLWLGLIIIGTSACTYTLSEEFPGDDLIQRQTMPVSYDDRAYSVSYLRAGDPMGQRIIFVHGTPGSASGWLEYLRYVPKGFEFIAIDRPGFGNTTPNKALVELDAQAAALEPFLLPRQGKYPILIGHSLGGPVVAAAAANYPDRVAGVIELAGSLDPDLEKLLFIQYVGELPPFVWMIPKDLKNTNREIFALEDELRLLGRKLHQVVAPVIIIHGTLDDLVPYANVPYMQRKFTNARILETVTLDGQNHFLPWNSAEAVKMAIDRIARDFPGPPRPELVIEASSTANGAGLNPPDSIFQR